MGTPIKSEKDTPHEPSEDLNEPAPNLNPNPDPSIGHTDDQPQRETELLRLQRYTGVLEENLREQNRTIQTQNDLLTRTPPAPVAPPVPPVDPQAARNEFYQDPVAVTRRTVREELESTVAPLLDFVKEFKGQGTATRLKDKFRNDPKFQPHWDDAVERSIDDAVSRVAPENLNDGTMQAIIVQSIGLKTMGLLSPSTNGNSNPNPPAPTSRPVSSQAHMRPTGPPAPSTQPGAKRLRALTENEERLRRENKMTHEEYLFWLELPADQVATATPPKRS